MAIGHRTNRLKLVGIPDVEQLQNGRYQLTINCTPLNKREAWYNSNKSRIFPDYGSLQSAEMSIDGLTPRTGEAYTDMRLVSVRSSSQGEQYIVTLVYQTLGSSFVQVKDDTVNYLENGLRRVTRNSIANAGTDFQKTVGTTSITSQIDGETAVTCVLANYEVNDTDSFREVTEVYVESGILTLSTPQIGGQQRVVVSAFNLTSTQVSNLLSEVTTNHKLIDSSTSNHQGIKTFQYTFDVDDFETTTQEQNGLKTLIRTELSASDFSDGNVGVDIYKTLTLANEEIDNGNTIKVKTSLFVEHGLLDESISNARDGIRNVSKTFLGTEEAVNGPITSRTVQNTNGIKTITVNFVEAEDGTKITGAATPQLVKQSAQHEPFVIPGLVRLLKSERQIPNTSSTGEINYSFDLTAPVQKKVLTTTFVLYQTSNSVDPANDYTYQGAEALWNPGSWAKSTTTGIDVDKKPFSISKAYRGYRAPSTFEQFTVVSGIKIRSPYSYNGRVPYYAPRTVRRKVFIDGYEMANNSLPTIELSGGPENPIGRKYVTSVSIDPAFTDVDGVQYYRKIIKVADVDGEQIDDALISNTGDDHLGDYVTAAAGTAGAGNNSFSIKLGDEYQAENDFYNGYLFTVFPRKKDTTNGFEIAQRMIVMDYRSDTNSILIKQNINQGSPVVGQYKGPGSISDNASYDFARITLDDYDLAGSGSSLLQMSKRSLVGKRFVLSTGNANLAPNGGVYAGFKVKIIDDGNSGSSGLNNNEYLISSYSPNLITITNGTGTSEMSDANYNALGNNITIEIVPQDSF